MGRGTRLLAGHDDASSDQDGALERDVFEIGRARGTGDEFTRGSGDPAWVGCERRTSAVDSRAACG
jgi:hypothetical protein